MRKRNERKDGWLTGNNIGVEGAKLMIEKLETNATLTSLNLGCEEEGNQRKRNERNDE